MFRRLLQLKIMFDKMLREDLSEVSESAPARWSRGDSPLQDPESGTAPVFMSQLWATTTTSDPPNISTRSPPPYADTDGIEHYQNVE